MLQTLTKRGGGKVTKKPNGRAAKPAPDSATSAIRRELQLSVGDFACFSEAMLILAEMAPERMTMSQALFFMLTASAELAGKQPTYSDVKEAIGDQLNRSLHTTYRILLEPSRAFPKGLGWLRAETNPADNRVKFLKLTDAGLNVMHAVYLALKGH